MTDWGSGNSSGGGGGRSGGGNITDFKKQPVPVLSMIDIKNIPLLDSGKTLLGRTVFTWLTRPAVYFNDSIDRLNCYMVPAVLMFFIAVISANVFGFTGGEPIRCLVSSVEA
ncbi:hypothetical protein AAVH_42526 [Aphelenchoides avenae]|nr:hypothetical protein AAVH_42526 [Aphelenchus avenae]